MPPQDIMTGQGKIDDWNTAISRCQSLLEQARVEKPPDPNQVPQSGDDVQDLHIQDAVTGSRQAELRLKLKEAQELLDQQLRTLSDLRLETGESQEITYVRDLRAVHRDVFDQTKLYAAPLEQQARLMGSEPGNDRSLLRLPEPGEKREEMLNVLADLREKDKRFGVFNVLQVYGCASSLFRRAQLATLQVRATKDLASHFEGSAQRLAIKSSELETRLKQSEGKIVELREEHDKALQARSEEELEDTSRRIDRAVELIVEEAVSAERINCEELMETMFSAEQWDAEVKKAEELANSLANLQSQLEATNTRLEDMEAIDAMRNSSQAQGERAALKQFIAYQKSKTEERIRERSRYEDKLGALQRDKTDIQGALAKILDEKNVLADRVSHLEDDVYYFKALADKAGDQCMKSFEDDLKDELKHKDELKEVEQKLLDASIEAAILRDWIKSHRRPDEYQPSIMEQYFEADESDVAMGGH